eukprot:NODE_426_length_1764_cov_50.805831_g357_i0.p2 GENE.NODE_426_length_1764_cov_50.805831_g357_i0~~NODE_426_length_1764_cov_50.805831_g357_i0.p2  ORF type:complete len:106 (-),score=30.01 NODE_426_length_1764_cov_50.805831_g357_i0:878-1195(-)
MDGLDRENLNPELLLLVAAKTGDLDRISKVLAGTRVSDELAAQVADVLTSAGHLHQATEFVAELASANRLPPSVLVSLVMECCRMRLADAAMRVQRVMGDTHGYR